MADVLEAIKAGFKEKIVHTSQGRDISFPMVEVKLDSRTDLNVVDKEKE